MKLGYFTMPLHPPARPYRDVLREDREAFIIADRLGFSEAYVGEHVTDRAEAVTSCLIFVASLAAETKTIKLGSGTVNMPNVHPATVAAQVAMVDTLLEGRFIFGISPGGLRSDAEMFGNLDADRTAMFREAIDIVLKLWSTEPPYRIKGQFWTATTERTLDAAIGQGMMVLPFQKPHPPIVIASMSPFSSSVSYAAERGWGVISANFLNPVWVPSHWKKMVEGCAAAGRTANPADWRVAKSVFVADDEATAKRYAKSVDGPYGFYYRNLMRKLVGNGRIDLFKKDRKEDDAAVTLERVLDDLVICGTPERVAEQIVALRGAIGDFGTLIYAGHDWADPKLAKRSMELMAEKVMPAVNKAIGAPKASQ